MLLKIYHLHFIHLEEFVVLNKTSLNVLALDFSPRLLWSKNLLMEPMTAILFAPPAMPHTQKKNYYALSCLSERTFYAL